MAVNDVADDPLYESAVAGFIRETAADVIRYDIIPANLTGRLLEIDPKHQEVRVRAGLSLDHFHRLVDRAVLYVVGGPSWAPEFQVKPNLQLVPVNPSEIEETARPADHLRPRAVKQCPNCRSVLGR